MLPYFIFNNISSKDYLILNRLPSIFKAARDIEKIEIEGRDGFLTKDNGAYKSIVKTVECTITDLYNIDFICSWLTGNGDVIFSNEPDKVYKATIINQIDFKKMAATFYGFIILFECQPHKHSINNNSVILNTSGTIFNPGTAISKPKLKVFGTGSINLSVNSNIINLINVNEHVTIDSELMDAYKDTMLKNNEMIGEFPELIPGTNNISWTGTVSKIEITPNWRWL